jgi:hypothetical protein
MGIPLRRGRKPRNLTVLSQMPCPICPFFAVIFWSSCRDLFVFIVSHVRQTCQSNLRSCPVLTILLWLSCPGCAATDVMSQLFCPGCPATNVMSQLPVLAFLYSLSCRGWPDVADLSRLTYRFLVRVVLSRLSCLGCSVMVALSQPSVPSCSFLSCYESRLYSHRQ